MNNELLLLSGADIPFISGRATIHQPRLKEISMIGEADFLTGCQFLNFSKDNLSDKDKSVLIDKSDFDIFMSMMNDNSNIENKKAKLAVMQVLTLMFPDRSIILEKDKISLSSEEIPVPSFINTENFDDFKDIIQSMYGLNEELEGKEEFNPADKMAARIAEKIKKGRARRNGQQSQTDKVAIFSRYASILAVGKPANINDLMDYTIYQIRDEFKRFQMKEVFDRNLSFRLAGATDLDEVDNWMDDIHP